MTPPRCCVANWQTYLHRQRRAVIACRSALKVRWPTFSRSAPPFEGFQGRIGQVQELEDFALDVRELGETPLRAAVVAKDDDAEGRELLQQARAGRSGTRAVLRVQAVR